MEIEIKTYRPEWGQDLEALQRRYIAAQPQGAKFVPAAFYHKHPAMEQGRNVFCAFARGQDLVGYGALIPTPADPGAPPEIPNTVWTYLRADPSAGHLAEIQDPIYQAILAKARTYSGAWKGRRTRLAAACAEPRQDEIAYFQAQGLRPCDALLQMGRSVSAPIETHAPPAGITVFRWPMETPQERAAYVAVEAQAFPHSPRSVEELESSMDSWLGGTPVTAFDAWGEIVGSVMAYWYTPRTGLTEDVFVVPAWRRRGIARCLIAEALAVLRENGIAHAGLEVRESNHPAVELYRSLGYQIAHREVHLELYLPETADG